MPIEHTLRRKPTAVFLMFPPFELDCARLVLVIREIIDSTTGAEGSVRMLPLTPEKIAGKGITITNLHAGQTYVFQLRARVGGDIVSGRATAPVQTPLSDPLLGRRSGFVHPACGFVPALDSSAEDFGFGSAEPTSQALAASAADDLWMVARDTEVVWSHTMDHSTPVQRLAMAEIKHVAMSTLDPGVLQLIDRENRIYSFRAQPRSAKETPLSAAEGWVKVLRALRQRYAKRTGSASRSASRDPSPNRTSPGLGSSDLPPPPPSPVLVAS